MRDCLRWSGELVGARGTQEVEKMLCKDKAARTLVSMYMGATAKVRHTCCTRRSRSPLKSPGQLCHSAKRCCRRYFPLIAGSAVGRRSVGSKASNIQVIDLVAGAVDNIARCDTQHPCGIPCLALAAGGSRDAEHCAHTGFFPKPAGSSWGPAQERSGSLAMQRPCRWGWAHAR